MLLLIFLLRSLIVCNGLVIEAPVERMNNQSYWSTWNRSRSPFDAPWKSSKRIITYHNEPFFVKGVNFNGIESNCNAPLGLNDRPLSYFLDLIQSKNFNALRIPLSYEVMSDLSINIGDCVNADSFLKKGMFIDDLIEYMLKECEKRNIFVLFDLHTIGGLITPLPWTDQVNENMVVEAWLNFLQRFHSSPALLGIEIKNEPHNEISMERFIEHCAKVIHNIETQIPEFKGLFFISGVQIQSPWGGAFDHHTLSFEGFTHPNMLCTVSTPTDRFIINPHVYGTSVRGPLVANEGPVEWENYYGFITSLPDHWNESAIVPTEWGGFLDDMDSQYYDRWLKWHVDYKNLTAGGFWWTLGPFSSDTGGLLDNNYNIIPKKLEFINRLVQEI